jgi:hypothetical protein
MSGQVLFDPHHPRLWRLAPPFHGSNDCHLERYDWGDGEPLVATTQDLPTVKVARLLGESILLGVWRPSPEGSTYAVCWLDAESLDVQRELALPGDLFGDFPWLRNVAPFGDGRFAVLTGSGAWTLHDAGDRLIIKVRHEVDEAGCIDVAPDGSLAVGGNWALKVFDPEPTELALPSD